MHTTTMGTYSRKHLHSTESMSSDAFNNESYTVLYLDQSQSTYFCETCQPLEHSQMSVIGFGTVPTSYENSDVQMSHFCTENTSPANPTPHHSQSSTLERSD